MAGPCIPTRIRVLEWIIQAIGIPVKPDYLLMAGFFNVQSTGVVSKNIYYLQDTNLL
jgi:hypothetical protein